MRERRINRAVRRILDAHKGRAKQETADKIVKSLTAEERKEALARAEKRLTS